MNSARNIELPPDIYKAFRKSRRGNRYLCKAPFAAMSIGINGFVSPCCYTQSYHAESPLAERYPGRSLMEIWEGKGFNAYRNAMKKRSMPPECSICYDAVKERRFDSAKILIYDHLKPRKKQPVFLELTLDNTCNLECVMCSSMYSSKIASQKGIETQSRIEPEKIKKEIISLIPGFQEVVFSGGEPFLSGLYKDILREIIKKNPSCLISVNTNGTVLTNEIKDLMEKGRFHLNISIDSVRKDTYEKIRRGASFDTLMTHMEYFKDYARRKGINLSMPVCPLVYNYEELPDLVEFCNKNDIYIEFVHVFNARDVALQTAGPDVLEKALRRFRSSDIQAESPLQQWNLAVFNDFMREIEIWIEKNRKLKKCIAGLSLDTAGYIEASAQHDEQIKEIFYENNGSINGKDFGDWKSSKEKLLEALPEYLKAGIIFEPVFNLKSELWIEYLQSYPTDELQQIFLSLADRLVLQACEEN